MKQLSCISVMSASELQEFSNNLCRYHLVWGEREGDTKAKREMDKGERAGEMKGKR